MITDFWVSTHQHEFLVGKRSWFFQNGFRNAYLADIMKFRKQMQVVYPVFMKAYCLSDS